MSVFAWMWREARPVSFATMLVWGAIFELVGASYAALELVGGLEGLAYALFLLVPVPALLWATVGLLKRDRRLPAGVPRGTA